MKFLSYQITGKGRGAKIGIPTINLKIPQNFKLKRGIYAVWVTIGDHKYQGALHYGPIPTFAQPEDNLEVILLDLTGSLENSTSMPIEIEIVKRIRPIKKFFKVEKLLKEINSDIDEAKKKLNLTKN